MHGAQNSGVNTRQVQALINRVGNLPCPEDWVVMEQALAAILDEAAARHEKIVEQETNRQQASQNTLQLQNMGEQ